jgi:uncharacterized protein (DUF433 family)
LGLLEGQNDDVVFLRMPHKSFYPKSATLTSMEVLTPNPIPIVETNGVLRVAGTRVTLDTVLECFLDGATPEEIVQRYPALDLVAVYEVIAYYLRHQEQLNAYLANGRTRAEAVRAEVETRYHPIGIRERLLKRQANEIRG